MARGKQDKFLGFLEVTFNYFFSNSYDKMLSLLLDKVLRDHCLLLTLVPASVKYLDSELLEMEYSESCNTLRNRLNSESLLQKCFRLRFALPHNLPR